MFECLEYYVEKADVQEGDTELKVNMGYGFMISPLLVLQGVSTSKGSEVHPTAYLFKPSKKSKTSSAVASETSISSTAPLQSLIEKKRKRKVIRKPTVSIPVPVPSGEHSGSNEQQLKRTGQLMKQPPLPGLRLLR